MRIRKNVIASPELCEGRGNLCETSRIDCPPQSWRDLSQGSVDRFRQSLVANFVATPACRHLPDGSQGQAPRNDMISNKGELKC